MSLWKCGYLIVCSLHNVSPQVGKRSYMWHPAHPHLIQAGIIFRTSLKLSHLPFQCLHKSYANPHMTITTLTPYLTYLHLTICSKWIFICWSLISLHPQRSLSSRTPVTLLRVKMVISALGLYHFLLLKVINRRSECLPLSLVYHLEVTNQPSGCLPRSLPQHHWPRLANWPALPSLHLTILLPLLHSILQLLSPLLWLLLFIGRVTEGTSKAPGILKQWHHNLHALDRSLHFWFHFGLLRGDDLKGNFTIAYLQLFLFIYLNITRIILLLTPRLSNLLQKWHTFFLTWCSRALLRTFFKHSF